MPVIGAIASSTQELSARIEAAAANNISTTNIDKLSFNKSKFIEAFEANSVELKQMLVGTTSNLGVLSRIESVVEQALASTSGYFASAENSLKTQAQKLNDKITRANAAVESYKARLEKKFQSMDLLISQIQDQYSSFLSF